MTFQPDTHPWVIQPHHVERVDVVLASPAGVNHLGLANAAGCWLHLKQSGPHARISAGEAIMLRPADIDQIIKLSWIWAQNHPGHPRGGELSDELSAGAKAAVMHFAQGASR